MAPSVWRPHGWWGLSEAPLGVGWGGVAVLRLSHMPGEAVPGRSGGLGGYEVGCG